MKKHTTKTIALLLAAAMLFLGASCTGSPAAPSSGSKTENLSAAFTAARARGRQADDAFAKAQAGFAVELFKNGIRDGNNSLVSPLSVLLALAMAANGADGETLAEMEKMLGLPIDELNEYAAAFANDLPNDEKCKVIPANSIWIRGKCPVKEDFLSKNAEYYGADAFRAPFDDGTVNDVNNWIREKTDGMIPKTIERIDRDTMMMLINALIFEAEWSEPYPDYAVESGVFHSPTGDEKAQLMGSKEQAYISDGMAEGFIKSYAGGRYSFAALLPNEGVSLSDYAASLTGEGLLETLSGAKDETVFARLPKFSYDYEIRLNDALENMGMVSAFYEGAADFSRMSELELYVGKVIHKTHIEVGEKGTRAGAVTVITFDSAGIETNVHEITLDRPFVYMIVDNATDLPIFIGTLNHVN